LSPLESRHARPEESPGFVLWQVATLWQQQMRRALAPLGLTHAQFVLLASAAWLSRQGEPVSQARIAEHARTDAVMTSEVLRTLVSKKLVRRLPHPADKRAWQIEPTAQGARLAQRAMRLVEAADEAFFGARPPELQRLAALLRKT
jgi:DNA-binding MarR family transcriptional regulator